MVPPAGEKENKIVSMNLSNQLRKEHSKNNCLKVVKWVGNSPARLASLLDLFLSDEYRMVQLAAWPLSYVAQAHPEMIRKHLPSIIRNLQRTDTHPAARRNTMRLLQYVEIPKKYQGLVMDRCFTYICDPKEKAAVKAFSLTVLENLSTQYPDIRNELCSIIEDRWDSETPAFRSRARKVLQTVKPK